LFNRWPQTALALSDTAAAFQCLLLIISRLLAAALYIITPHRRHQVTGGRGGCRTDVAQHGDAAEGWHGPPAWRMGIGRMAGRSHRQAQTLKL